jgi:hypothetical protein
MAERSTPPEHPEDHENPKAPKVGLGATLYLGSDRYPFTVVDVKSDKTIVVQEDRATRSGPPHPYEYSRNRQAPRIVMTLRKNGYWAPRGYAMSRGEYLVLGHREKYLERSY